MNLYGNQRWNQVLQKGKHFLLRMWHPSWNPLFSIKEWNVLMTTISWPTDVISRGGHWYTIRKCQIMVTTKKVLCVDLSLVSMESWLRSFLAKLYTLMMIQKGSTMWIKLITLLLSFCAQCWTEYVKIKTEIMLKSTFFHLTSYV